MHAPRVRQLIVLHDTTVDGAVGEAVRLGQGVGTLAQAAGWPERDVAEGIWPAAMRVLLAAVPSFRVPNFNFNFNSTLALLSACAGVGAATTTAAAATDPWIAGYGVPNPPSSPAQVAEFLADGGRGAGEWRLRER